MQVTTIQAGDARQVREVAEQASAILSSGGLVVFPTETVYGIAASAGSQKGLEALRAFKERPDAQPFSVHMPTPAAAERYIDITTPVVGRLVRKVFPGPVTLVVRVEPDVIQRKMRRLASTGLPATAWPRIYHQHTVGLRCPDHVVAQRVLASVADPVVASSANRRGQPPPHDADEAAAAVGQAAALVIDGGPCRYAKASTVVRVGPTGQITVERDGVYDERFIRELLRWTMLLVCSGNTCRSPMAEALAKRLLADERGLNVDDLEAAGLRVVSAGASAQSGLPASPEAVSALARMGIDLAKHRSRPLTPELIHEADVIYCMTRSHREAVTQLVSSAADKTFVLDPSGDIEDPIGSGPTAYQRCAELIRRRLAQRLKEQQP